jgi:hypothetical protein
MMPLKLALLCLAGGLSVWAQSPGARELDRALANVEELRKQVEAGVTPRVKLEQAEEALADARDADLLGRTLYGKDLTEEQSSEMEAAAARRVERRKANIEKLQALIDVGALPVTALDQPKEDLQWSEKEYELVSTRAALVSELAAMARVEQQASDAEASETTSGPVMERFDGDGSFTREDFKHVVLAYEKRFGKSLPISAQGETALHRALGFDHRDRVDVALYPDTPEGSWLRRYLESSAIPYYAFRSFVPGKATAAHIHIGPPSNRILKAD